MSWDMAVRSFEGPDLPPLRGDAREPPTYTPPPARDLAAHIPPCLQENPGQVQPGDLDSGELAVPHTSRAAPAAAHGP